MSQNGNPRRSTLATASRVETTHGKTIYATDLGPARPISRANRAHVFRNRRKISVGHVELTPFGVLRCTRRGDTVVVSLHRGKARAQVGRSLILTNVGESDGPFRETDFSVEVSEFIGTPWHELDYTSLWTVHGLRTKGGMEASIDG